MRHHIRTCSLATLAILALLTCASLCPAAAPKVGEKPKFSFKTIDGKLITPDTLKGRIVVFDFWATWCGPCMHEAPHMVKLNAEYAPKGVQIIGISMDQDAATATKTAKEHGLVWPQVWDGSGWHSTPATAWDVHAIPQVFVLSPDGVLLKDCDPTELDGVLAEIVKKYPTAGPLRARATDVLKEASKILADTKDPDKALAKLADIPDGVKPDSALTEAAQSFMNNLDDDKARAALAANTSAAKTLDALGAKPPAPKVAVAAAADAKPAGIPPQVLDARLAAAEKERAAGLDLDAYPKYKWIAEKAPDSPQAEAAAKQVAIYEADTAFLARQAKAKHEQEAAALLWEANGQENNGRVDAAKATYKKIVTNYKETPSAGDAAKALARLR